MGWCEVRDRIVFG